MLHLVHLVFPMKTTGGKSEPNWNSVSQICDMLKEKTPKVRIWWYSSVGILTEAAECTESECHRSLVSLSTKVIHAFPNYDIFPQQSPSQALAATNHEAPQLARLYLLSCWHYELYMHACFTDTLGVLPSTVLAESQPAGTIIRPYEIIRCSVDLWLTGSTVCGAGELL